jgi:hypothetical protein
VPALPRSVALALWLAAPPAGRASVRHGAAAVQQDDEPHVVRGLPGHPDPTDLETVLRTWAGRAREVVAMLPVPGDLGVPPEVAALAADAGECVLVLAGDDGWALVPEVVAFGSAGDLGHQVTWRVRQLPSGRRSLVGTVGTLAESEHDLRSVLREAVTALDDLDVARWRPEAADALARWRSDAGPGPLPDGLEPRAVRVLVEALRLRDVVALATADDGGAVNLWQADQRSTALREVDRVSRRAVAAATLAAGRRQPSTER